MKTQALCLLVVVGLLASAPNAGAQQNLGTHVWQFQPFCDYLIVDITASPGNFTFGVSGVDDNCNTVRGTSAQEFGANGNFFMNPNGTIGMAVTTVFPQPTGGAHSSAVISPITFNGTWEDEVGSGPFVYIGAFSSTSEAKRVLRERAANNKQENRMSREEARKAKR